MGDTIVIASTDYAAQQSETRVISAISGRTISFITPLQYMHYGKIWVGEKPEHAVDMRAEVFTYSNALSVDSTAT